MKENIEAIKTFTNKQVITLVSASIIGTFFVSDYIFTFDDNDKRLDTIELLHEKDMLNQAAMHDREIDALKEEMKLVGKFFQDQLNANQENNKRRTNTIRDRHDERLKELEKANSDKN